MAQQQHGPAPAELTFEHLPDVGRFRALRAGREVALLDYVRGDGAWDLVHTWADPGVRGSGIASDLVTNVMDSARSEGVQIVPSCPYIPVWLRRHPGYADLVRSR